MLMFEISATIVQIVLIELGDRIDKNPRNILRFDLQSNICSGS